MRKPAPALILTALIAFATGSALAGDRTNKTADASTQPVPSSTTVPGSSPSPTAPTKATVDGSAASAPATQPATGTSGSVDSSMSSNGATKPMKPKGNKDGKCDEAKLQNKAAIPPECAEKVSPGK